MESASSISPASLLSRLRTLAFTALALRLSFSCRFRCRRGAAIDFLGLLHRSGHFRVFRQGTLHGIAHHHPAALMTRDRALHHDEPALDIHLRTSRFCVVT